MPKISVQITYPIEHPERHSIETDMKEDKVVDLLSEWLRDQTGKGADYREANDADVYHITISMELANDSFSTKSDTGNDGLTVGIVADVLKRLKV